MCLYNYIVFLEENYFWISEPLDITVEYVLNKGGDDLSDSSGNHHSPLQSPKQYFSSINPSSSVF